MKKIISLIFTLLITANLFALRDNTTQKADPKIRMAQLRKDLSENLTKNLLPYWSTKMVDNVNGGFYGRINSSDQVFPNEDKGGILNARILWTYSAAFRVTGDTSYLRLATRAKNYILAQFIDKQYGGAYRSVKANGDPSDMRKQTYTQSFFIYGMAEYCSATGDKEALQTAIDIYKLFEQHALDKDSNGYFEVFTRDWKRTHDRLIGEKSDKDEKTMNTSLHLMEAYASLYRIWPDKVLANRLKNMVEIFLDKIVDEKTYHLICFMERNWNSTSSTDSYGHDIEASWLIYEAAGLLKDKDLISRARKTCIRIADAASAGIQQDGSMIYEKDYITGAIEKNRSWWPQAETVVGYMNAYQLTGNEKYLDFCINNWNYIRTHLVDYKNGGWYSGVNESGVVSNGDKGGFWTCPYHNGRMCLEIIERVSVQ